MDRQKLKKFGKNCVKAAPWVLLAGVGAVGVYVHVKYKNYIYLDLSPETQKMLMENAGHAFTFPTPLGDFLVFMEA
ncbi:MAG TPA: hypothetical protein PKW49_00895 [Paludibacteraceae bacterium]|nr:hypothetical protein [Paludibacteraceae bacterium]